MLEALKAQVAQQAEVIQSIIATIKARDAEIAALVKQIANAPTQDEIDEITQEIKTNADALTNIEAAPETPSA